MTLPTIFATLPAGPVPASDLDTNFSVLEGAIVQPVVTTGTANTYILTPADVWIGGYANYKGNALTVIPNVTNTGATTVNVSGLGAVNLYKNAAATATALAAGDFTVGIPYVIICDGINFWLSSNPTPPPTGHQQTFTSSGTFTVPANTLPTTIFKFTVTGGGGNVPSTDSTHVNSGAGSGATAIYYATSLTASSTIAVTVGAAAGNSSIVVGATTITANGGSVGVNATTNLPSNGGNGGTAANGTINISGGGGGAGWYSAGNSYVTGAGGASFWGGGGAAAGAGAQNPGTAPGSGAGGGGPSSASASGAAGIVTVEWVL